MESIAVIPGDGIGPEVVDAALTVLDGLHTGMSFDVLEHVNGGTFQRTATALTDTDLDRVRKSSAILLGAVGVPDLEHTSYVRDVLTGIRFDLDLYVNYRPVRLWHDAHSPLRDAERRAIDCVVVRENTEGLYCGIGGSLRPASEWETAVDAEINTHRGVSRVLDFAFSTARREVCMVDKANAVRSGGQLWQRCFEAAARSHPGVRTSHAYVDAAAMRLIADPRAFDVIVTNNSYGDILSDITAALAGGLGMAPSANINPDNGCALFEPVHGSASDIAGTGTANPLGTVLASALMLEHLDHRTEAAAVRAAVGSVVAAHRVTPDLGGDLSTTQVTSALVAAL